MKRAALFDEQMDWFERRACGGELGAESFPEWAG